MYTAWIGHDLNTWLLALFGGIASKNMAVMGSMRGFLKNAQRSNERFIMVLNGAFMAVRMSKRTETSILFTVITESMEAFNRELVNETLTFA